MGKLNGANSSIISLQTTLVNELGVDPKMVLNPSFRIVNLPKDLKWTDEYKPNMRILEGTNGYAQKYSILIKKDGPLFISLQRFNRALGLSEEHTDVYSLGQNDELVMDMVSFNSNGQDLKPNTVETERRKYDQFGTLISKRKAKAINKNEELDYSYMPNGLISLDTNNDLASLNKVFKDNDYYMDVNSYELTRMEYYLELARLGTIDLTGEVEFNYVPLYRRNRSDIDTHSFYDLHNRQFSDYIPSDNVNLDEIRKLVLAKEKLERLIRSRELLAVEDESIWEIESMLHKAGPRLSKEL